MSLFHALFNRREFMAGGGLFAALSLIKPVAAETPLAPAAAPKLSGRLHAIGMNGVLFGRPVVGPDRLGSVLTTIDLADGKIKQTLVPVQLGHYAVDAGGGNILCVGQYTKTAGVFDADHKTVTMLEAPENYLFSGHGHILPGSDTFICTVTHAAAKTADDHGLLLMYDLKTHKFVDRFDSGGLHPHDIAPIPGTDELVLSHYGDTDAGNNVYENSLLDPKITILDAKTLKVRRQYPQDFKAAVSHLSVDHEGWVYFVLNRGFPVVARPMGEGATAPFKGQIITLQGVDKIIEHETGKPRDFDMPWDVFKQRKFYLPYPFVRLNTQTGEKQELSTGNGNHLMSQSVAYNKETRTGIAVYVQSENLVLHQAGKDPYVVHGHEMGLTLLRGVSDIPGTTCVAVTASDRGTAIYDIAARRMVAHYPHLTYGVAHISHQEIA